MAVYNGWNKKREKIDWDAIDEGGREPLPPGIYRAQCSQAMRKAVSDGKPGMEIQWSILTNEDGEEISGHTIYDTMALTTGPKGGAWKVKQMAIAADIDLPEGDSEEDVGAFCDGVLESEVWVRLIIQPYKGKDYNRIGVYLTEEQANGEPQGDKPAAKPAKKKAGKKAKRPEPEEEEDTDEDAEDVEEEEEEEKPAARRTQQRRTGRR